MPCAAGLSCGKRRFSVRKPSAAPGAVSPSCRPSLRPYGVSGHVAGGQRLAHGRAADAQAVHLIAHHAGDIEALGLAGGVQRRVVALALGTETEVVADQHVFRAQALDQHLADEVLCGQRGQCLVERQDDDLVDPAAFQLDQLVA